MRQSRLVMSSTALSDQCLREGEGAWMRAASHTNRIAPRKDQAASLLPRLTGRRAFGGRASPQQLVAGAQLGPAPVRWVSNCGCRQHRNSVHSMLRKEHMYSNAKYQSILADLFSLRAALLQQLIVKLAFFLCRSKLEAPCLPLVCPLSATAPQTGSSSPPTTLHM